MKKTIKYMMLMLVTTLCLSLAACGGKNNEPEQPENPPVAPAEPPTRIDMGSLPIGSRVTITDTNVRFRCVEGKVEVFPKDAEIDPNPDPKICYVGTVSSMQEIKNAPASGWATEAELVNKGGYVITYTDGKALHYVRLEITLKYNSSDKLTSFSYVYQHFKPANL